MVGEGAKLGAAEAVLAHMTRLGEHADLTERVESLERQRGLRAVS